METETFVNHWHTSDVIYIVRNAAFTNVKMLSNPVTHCGEVDI
jgi:hypothetical protein